MEQFEEQKKEPLSQITSLREWAQGKIWEKKNSTIFISFKITQVATRISKNINNKKD